MNALEVLKSLQDIDSGESEAEQDLLQSEHSEQSEQSEQSEHTDNDDDDENDDDDASDEEVEGKSLCWNKTWKTNQLQYLPTITTKQE